MTNLSEFDSDSDRAPGIGPHELLKVSSAVRPAHSRFPLRLTERRGLTQKCAKGT